IWLRCQNKYRNSLIDHLKCLGRINTVVIAEGYFEMDLDYLTLNKLRRAFYSQRWLAINRRNIEWDLTFDDWLVIWVKSGHLAQRGIKRGQYVMARKGDVGPYSKNNVKIIL